MSYKNPVYTVHLHWISVRNYEMGITKRASQYVSTWQKKNIIVIIAPLPLS